MKTQTSVPRDDMGPDESEPAVLDTLKAIQEEQGVFAAIGGTPMVRLARVIPNLSFNLYAKLEFLNPGGSIKDRVALSIIRKALENGDVGPHSVIIESSSGNMGIGLAQMCAYYGLRFICVVDSKTTSQNIRLLEAYGAEVDMVSVADSRTGEFLQARIERVKFLLHSVEHAFWPNQYANPGNPLAHHQTMQEIVSTLGGPVDYVVCATSTCGTLRGCAEYVREHGLGTRIIAVDAVGSVIFGGEKARRLVPGHGAALVPDLYRPDLAHSCVHVSDLDCVVGCRRLVQREAILAGGSSGAVLTAVDKLKEDIRPDANCVVILADRGERYLDTIYSDSWIRRYFGDVLKDRLTSEHIHFADQSHAR